MAKGIYDLLMQRILDAQEQMLKHEVEANTVIINGNKYGDLARDINACKYTSFTPCIFGMAAVADNLPNDYDFIIQHRTMQPITEYERLVNENNDLKRKLKAISDVIKDD